MTKRLSTASVAVTLSLVASLVFAQEGQLFDPTSEATVLEVQEELTELGFDPGTPDGKLGRNTRQAIRSFQERFGFEQTGEISLLLTEQIDQALVEEAKRQQVRKAIAGLGSGNTAAFSAGMRDPELAELLIARPEAVKALRAAVENNDHGLAESLLNSGVRDREKTGTWSLIHLALARSDDAMLALVASNTDNLEERDGGGLTPLIKAMREREYDAAAILIDAGADVTNDSYRGITALHFAADAGQADLVNKLIGKGAKLDVRDQTVGITPVEAALSTGHMEIAAALMKRGPAPDPERIPGGSDLSIEGFYGESGLIERATSVALRDLKSGEDGIDRVFLVVEAGSEDAPFEVILPGAAPSSDTGVVVHSGSSGKIVGDEVKQMDVIVGLAGNYWPADGEIQRLKLDGTVLSSKVAGIVIGPEGTLRGSHVVATSGAHAATSGAATDGMDLTDAELDGSPTLYLIGGDLKLTPVE